MKTRTFKILVWREDKHYVAQCLNNNVSSFGNTKEEALKNLKEANELFYEDEKAPSYVNVEKPEILESTITYA